VYRLKNNPLEDSINEISEVKENLLGLIKNSKKVKDGVLTEEEAMHEPENIVYLNIVDTIIHILKNEELSKQFKLLEENNISNEAIKILINIIAVITTNATYSAVVFYDELLKKELSKQFDNLGNHINKLTSEINGIKPACEVYNKKIGNIEKILKINEIKQNEKV
jgi:hypothetical protein